MCHPPCVIIISHTLMLLQTLYSLHATKTSGLCLKAWLLVLSYDFKCPLNGCQDNCLLTNEKI